jgi:hypothetical protein
MISVRMRAAVVVLMFAPGLTSCRLFRKPKLVPMPAPPVQVQPAPVQKPPSPEPEIPPPELKPVEPPPPGVIPQPQPELPPPSPPSQKRPSPLGPRAPAPAAQPPPAPAPQLRPMLSSAQRRELERTISERIGRARGVLKSLEGKRLAREQTDIVNQIRTFIEQAEEARRTDLLRANNLAERAEVLANDLANRVR